eukprot:357796-Chlamydomonas_euryale.AAC.2
MSVLYATPSLSRSARSGTSSGYRHHFHPLPAAPAAHAGTLTLHFTVLPPVTSLITTISSPHVCSSPYICDRSSARSQQTHPFVRRCAHMRAAGRQRPRCDCPSVARAGAYPQLLGAGPSRAAIRGGGAWGEVGERRRVSRAERACAKPPASCAHFNSVRPPCASHTPFRYAHSPAHLHTSRAAGRPQLSDPLPARPTHKPPVPALPSQPRRPTRSSANRRCHPCKTCTRDEASPATTDVAPSPRIYKALSARRLSREELLLALPTRSRLQRTRGAPPRRLAALSGPQLAS